MESTSKRIGWIDTAKAFGIFLVYYGHIAEFFYWQEDCHSQLLHYKFVYSFHMPLFFVLSGYCWRRKGDGFAAFIRKKTFTRLIPFVVFNLMVLPVYLIYHGLQNTQGPSSSDYLSYVVSPSETQVKLLAINSLITIVSLLICCPFVSVLKNYMVWQDKGQSPSARSARGPICG